MWRRRACLVTALGAAIGIACGSSSSTSDTADAGPDAAGDGAIGADANPGDCPPAQPSMGDSCDGNRSCAYGCESCECIGAKWLCSAPGCSGIKPCPVAQPSEGDSCATSGGCCAGTQESPCTYPMDGGTPSFTATCAGGVVWHVAPTDAGSD